MRNHPLIVEFAKNALQAFRPALPIRPSEPFLSHCKQILPDYLHRLSCGSTQGIRRLHS
jgi:hypothetical protein